MSAYILSDFSHLIKIPSFSTIVRLALGGGIAMGAFCVFGVSHTLCKAAATKKTPSYDSKKKRNLSREEWAARRDELAEAMFAEAKRRVKISPELDAPQFCRDWLAVDREHVRDPVVMVRGPKMDKHGNVVKRNGAVVETWLEYASECARLGIEVGA